MFVHLHTHSHYSLLDGLPKIPELAKNQAGYKNLLKLPSRAHLEGFYYKPRIDWELLTEHHEGLIASTACLQGEVPRAILSGNLAKAEELILKYQSTFGDDNFYLELQHNPNIPDQATVNDQLVEFSKKLNLPLIATNDVHYLNPDDAEAQDILLCIQTKKKQAETDRMTMLGEDFSFTSPEKMKAAFAHLPQALANTLKIAEQSNLEIELGKVLLPYFAVPNGQTADDYLTSLCEQGLKKRYGDSPAAEVKERLNYEISG